MNSTPYRISLFDDIHNYLPELLYNRGRFHNVQDILNYVHHVASTQLNPWTYAAADYNIRQTWADDIMRWDNRYNTGGGPIRRNARRFAGTGQPHNTRYNPRMGATIPVAHMQQQQQQQQQPRTMLRSTSIPAYQDATYMNNYGFGGVPVAPVAPATGAQEDLISLINAAFGLVPPATTQPRASWLDPVVIRPTGEQIEAASHPFMIADLSADTNDRCAICQEDFIGGAAARRLTVCRHLFHRECIDRWFNTSVRCPVCRYDIRTPTVAFPLPPAVANPPPSPSPPYIQAAAVPTASALSNSPISDSTMSAAIEALMSLITNTGTTNAGDNITIRIDIEDTDETQQPDPEED